VYASYDRDSQAIYMCPRECHVMKNSKHKTKDIQDSMDYLIHAIPNSPQWLSSINLVYLVLSHCILPYLTADLNLLSTL